MAGKPAGVYRRAEASTTQAFKTTLFKPYRKAAIRLRTQLAGSYEPLRAQLSSS